MRQPSGGAYWAKVLREGGENRQKEKRSTKYASTGLTVSAEDLLSPRRGLMNTVSARCNITIIHHSTHESISRLHSGRVPAWSRFWVSTAFALSAPAPASLFWYSHSTHHYASKSALTCHGVVIFVRPLPLIGQDAPCFMNQGCPKIIQRLETILRIHLRQELAPWTQFLATARAPAHRSSHRPEHPPEVARWC